MNGIDIFRLIENEKRDRNGGNFPPYNIVCKDNFFELSLAVAGFSKEELDVKIDNNYSLVISGNPALKEDGANVNYIHKGIARRSFQKIFRVDFDMKVNEAKLENGILTVIVEIIIPEHQKPHSIQIS